MGEFNSFVRQLNLYGAYQSKFDFTLSCRLRRTHDVPAMPRSSRRVSALICRCGSPIPVTNCRRFKLQLRCLSDSSNRFAPVRLAGPDRGAYFHPYFLRGDSTLCHRIERIKVKGKGHRKPSIPEEEPDFYTFPPLPQWKPNETSIVSHDRSQDPFRLHAAHSQSVDDRPSTSFVTSPPFASAPTVAEPSALVLELRRKALEYAPVTSLVAPSVQEQDGSALIAHLRRARASRYTSTSFGSANHYDVFSQASIQSLHPSMSQPALYDSSQPSRIDTRNHASRLLLLQSLQDQQVLRQSALSLPSQRIAERFAATSPSLSLPRDFADALRNVHRTLADPNPHSRQTKDQSGPQGRPTGQRKQSHDWLVLSPKPPPGLG